MKRTFTEEEKHLFETYFNVADEIYESLARSPRHPLDDGSSALPPLTLADLDNRWVQQARLAAEKFGLSWPPYLPEAEEFSLDHKELRSG
jgi:hypothetical protein